MADCERGMWALPISNGAKALCALLWTYLDTVEGGEVWPSVGTLAEQTSQNERTVRRQIDELRDAGLVVRTGHTLVLHRLDREGKPDPTARIRHPQKRASRSGGRAQKRASASEDRASASAKAGTTTPQGNQREPVEGTIHQGLLPLGADAARRDFVRELWDYFEAACVKAGLAKKHRGLSPKRRKRISALLSHIRQTLHLSAQEAAHSQARHLKYRIARASEDHETRSRLRTETAWREGWWDWWQANVDDGASNAASVVTTAEEAIEWARAHGNVMPAGWGWTIDGKAKAEATS